MNEVLHPSKLASGEKASHKDEEGKIVYATVPELPYLWSAKLWEQKNKEINETGDRSNCQIVVLTPNSQDVTTPFYQSLRKNPLGKFPVATTHEQEFPDGELKILLDQEAVGAHSVYIVASILTERDYSRVRRVADHYKNTLGTKYVTLFCPYLGSTREDKNVNSAGEYEPSVTSVRAEIGGLSPFVDRMIVLEPHSSATQYYAATFRIPLLPISPWIFSIQELVKITGLDSKNTLVIRPDKGRNLAANRIGDFLKIPKVSFEKTRISGQAVSFFQLSEVEQSLVKGKDCLIYDDEGSTMGTIFSLAEALQNYGAKSLTVCLVHCKFTPGWENKVRHPLFSIILGTDSRKPIGNIRIADGKIKIVSIEPLIREVIQADIEGVNFWQDKNFKQMVLQEE